ncbi:haloacid dehalogenase-like hydrolase [Strigomonas culicis]|uniref:Haloacid dehalogenase-like hydrolase n=1 Tax=Strigomonas culicis TaxID=28005 RepID=S9UVV5_9TRYP|nr:haloacid dehalogenase-like hydrolase [Strigomonas culicis]|eukprot:EPY32924.1 haloacid dehalogenase-like hydrolase [Strigomonas culicis]
MDVFATLEDAGLAPDYVITSNGARIHDKHRQLVSRRDLDVNFLRAAIAEASGLAGQGPAYVDNAEARSQEDVKRYGTAFHKDRKFTINMYREDAWLLDISVEIFYQVAHPSFRYKVLGVEGVQRLTDAELEGTHELFFVGPPDNLLTLKTQLQPLFDGHVHCTFSTPFLLVCVSSDIHKGKALVEVCGLLGIDTKDVVAFGDGMNDEPMLRIAGHPFIMRNASNALKEALPEATVIGTNMEGGVVKKLEELLPLP